MSNVPVLKVELEVDPSSGIQPFFTLDDPELGLLDGEYGLGGLTYADASEYVQEVSVSRGKTNPLNRYDAGNASVVFDNTKRIFDPLGTSPFSQQLLPRRGIRIYSGGTPVFFGIVEDWNLDYDRSGDNRSIAIATDRFLLLANQELDEYTNVVEKSGERIEAVLDKSEVQWPVADRNIETGQITLQADLVEDNTNVLNYLQRVSESESGSLFIAKDGKLTFFDKLKAPSSSDLVTFSDDGVDLPFQEIQAVYGGEFLYNRVVIQRANGTAQIAEDLTSQDFYGVSTLSQTDLLMNSDSDALDKAETLLARYKQPTYRFESISTYLHTISLQDALTILGRDLTDVIQVRFTPNKVGSEIDKLGSIIGIEHRITPASHIVTFNLDTLDFAPFVLDDAVFGVLDEYGLG